MNRENIISLAREHWHRDSFNIEYFDAVAFYHASIADFLKESGQYVTNDATREACIKQAQREAFESAAKLCDNNACDYTREGAEVCAAAIREMAKEMK